MKIQLLFLLLFFTTCYQSTISQTIVENNIIEYHIVDLQQDSLHFFWKNKDGKIYQTFSNLKKELSKDVELHFAMNGGMFNKDFSPQGLYIEKGEPKAPLDTLQKGYGNFYLQPNGIFSITKDKKPSIQTTKTFSVSEDIYYATQSGPMLLINGEIHPKFTKGSKNLHIRNGVGILPDGKLLFAISKEKINFYDFATFFKKNACQNALYLDGFVSKMYLPTKGWELKEGRFGVIIGVVK